jgi:hypothetical protein
MYSSFVHSSVEQVFFIHYYEAMFSYLDILVLLATTELIDRLQLII